MVKECATPLNYSKGEVSRFSVPSSQSQGDPKEKGAHQTQPKQTPLPSKQ